MNLSVSEAIRLTEEVDESLRRQFEDEFTLILEGLSDADQIKALSGANKTLIDRVFCVLKPKAKKAILKQQWEDFIEATKELQDVNHGV